MAKVLVWTRKDIRGTRFVDGSMFFKKEVGDIKASKPYTNRELAIKSQFFKLPHASKKQLEIKIKKIAGRYDHRAKIKHVD